MLELGRVTRGSHVLVVGTGTGEDALEAASLAGTAGEVVATDLSVAMISEATRSATATKVGNVRFLVMDAQRLEFEASTFDAVISRNALMFIPDLMLALAEIHRVLKSGGHIAASVWASGRRNVRLSDPLEAARALGARPPASAMFRIALRLGSASLLSKALVDAGFAGLVVERWPVVARYASIDEAVQQAMDHAGTRELMQLVSDDAADAEQRMRRSLTRRWQKYSVSGGVQLPGEQLVAAGEKAG